jgi:hypothetical protein
MARETVPTTVAARSKAWRVFARSNSWVMSSNPTRGMDVCAFVLCVGSGLATDWSPVKGLWPSVYRINKLKSGRGQIKGCRQMDRLWLFMAMETQCAFWAVGPYLLHIMWIYFMLQAINEDLYYESCLFTRSQTHPCLSHFSTGQRWVVRFTSRSYNCQSNLVLAICLPMTYVIMTAPSTTRSLEWSSSITFCIYLLLYVTETSLVHWIIRII